MANHDLSTSSPSAHSEAKGHEILAPEVPSSGRSSAGIDRRRVMKGLALMNIAVPTAAFALDSEHHPDAELLRLGAKIEELGKKLRPHVEAANQVEDAWFEAVDPRRTILGAGQEVEEWFASQREFGIDAAWEPAMRIYKQLEKLDEESFLRAEPKTLEGLAVQARCAKLLALNTRYEGSLVDADYDIEIFRRLVDSAIRLGNSAA